MATTNPVSQSPSIPAGSHVPASPTNTVSTVAARGISAAISTSTAPAQPLAGAQSYNFYKRFFDARVFIDQNNGRSAIDVLLEMIEKAKGVKFEPDDLIIVFAQTFLARLYGEQARLTAAEGALKNLDQVFANRAAWNPERITTTYTDATKILNSLEFHLKSLIQPDHRMRQNIKLKLAICEGQLRERLSEFEIEELQLFPSVRKVTNNVGEVSLYELFACFVATVIVWTLYLHSRSIVKIS